jgi:hypothetical protein
VLSGDWYKFWTPVGSKWADPTRADPTLWGEGLPLIRRRRGGALPIQVVNVTVAKYLD